MLRSLLSRLAATRPWTMSAVAERAVEQSGAKGARVACCSSLWEKSDVSRWWTVRSARISDRRLRHGGQARRALSRGGGRCLAAAGAVSRRRALSRGGAGVETGA
eukprot:916739-Pleurochrysis_carterae.AAC.1